MVKATKAEAAGTAKLISDNSRKRTLRGFSHSKNLQYYDIIVPKGVININTKKILPVIVVVIVLGLVSLLYLNRNRQTISNNSEEIENNQETVTEKFTGSLKEAISMGVGMKCTYEVDGVNYEGYVKGKNYSGQLKTADGQTGNVIVKDDCVWSWSSEQDQGVKICYEPEDVETDSESVWDQKDVVDQDVIYNCTTATVPDSEFTPPATVNFIDTDDMMKQYGMQGVIL